MERGILRLKKDPKNQMLFSFIVRSGEEWPSSDSDDPDFRSSTQKLHTHKTKFSKTLKRPLKTKVKKVRERKESKKQKVEAVQFSDGCSTAMVVGDDQLICKTDSEATLSDNLSVCDECCSISESVVNLNPWGQAIPELVLLHIFRFAVDSVGAVPFLNSASRVCRLWNNVCANTSLWKKLDLSYGWVKCTDETLQHLCKNRLPKLVEINLSNWKALTAKGLKILADGCPLLSSINLSRCRVNSAGILYFVEKCGKLSSLDMSSYAASDGVSAKTLSQVIGKCSVRLRSLNLSGNTLKGFIPILKAVSTSCPCLEVLDISYAVFSTDFVNVDIEKLQWGCPRLAILRLSNSKIRFNCASALEKVSSPGFAALRELSLTCGDRRDDILHRILKRSRGLKLLDLRGWSCLDGDSLQSIPVSDLERLYISGCSEGIELIMSKWHHSLIDLDLSWNIYPGLSLDMAMKKLASDPSISRLEVLDLRGTQISAGRVKYILEGCPCLRMLSLESCRGLPRGMKKGYVSDTLAQLRLDIDSFIALEESP